MQANSVEFLTRLVAATSVSSTEPEIDSSNKQAAQVVAQMLEDYGFRVKLHPVPALAGKFNVVASIGPEQEKTGLVLAGHTDTVPCNPERWSASPFELTERDGKLYGLGACDMKGFFAVLNQTLAGLDFKKLQQPLQVWATANEECGMQGAAAIADQAPAAAVAIIGEPTENRPIFGHKGVLAEKIIISGKAGHASAPAKGASAIEAARLILNALAAWRDDELAKSCDDDFVPANSTLNFGLLKGGDSANRICDRCEIWIDVRLLPDQQPAKVREQAYLIASQAIADLQGINIEFSKLVLGFNATRCNPTSAIVQAAAELSAKQPATAAYATEAPFYAQMGMDVVVFGAGSINQAHQIDEFIDKQQADQMATILCQLIKKFCY